MLTETSITLYNKYVEKATGKELYKRTFIEKTSNKTGATWQGQKITGVSTTETGKGVLNVADSINIRIPLINNFEGKSYIEPKAWLKLTDLEKDNYFTFQSLDRIVKGECNFIVTSTNPITNLSSYDNIVTIMSIKINDFGSKMLNHYALGGK